MGTIFTLVDYPFARELGLLLSAACALILPAATLMGVAFPVGMWLWSGDAGEVSVRLGAFYAVNTIGAVAGALVAAFCSCRISAPAGALSSYPGSVL